ncbi:unnamed protein product [Strongylus vulgaris]|uniref:Uncharacterized protein n=1 Tax=Strongylus vulgaris TaxID=40348 RepID=A0A3P7IPK3_STRVU|nr:unnamed protein product [Strongylus vulgaris]
MRRAKGSSDLLSIMLVECALHAQDYSHSHSKDTGWSTCRTSCSQWIKLRGSHPDGLEDWQDLLNRQPPVLIFVDYKKALDSIETNVIPSTLIRQGPILREDIGRILL